MPAKISFNRPPLRIKAFLLLFTLCHSIGAASGVADRVATVVDSSELPRHAFAGIHIVDLRTGQTVYSLNSGHTFLPASNMKLFTTALALIRLGPDARFITIATASGKPDGSGVIHGDLRLVGGGDPNLSGRILPYDPKATPADPTRYLKELASSVAKAGVTRIDGNVVGDDSAFVYEPYAPTWTIDDPTSDDGAPVSALTFNDNSVTLTITPGAHVGAPATVSIAPADSGLTIQNTSRTVANNLADITVERLPGSDEIELRGTIGLSAPADVEAVSVADPALFAARAFRDALEAQGIRVSGDVLARHRYAGERGMNAPGVELARHVSDPLVEDLQVIDKESQNLHAELALRNVGFVRDGTGSRKAGLEELAKLLEGISIPKHAYHFEDGSGLSHLSEVSPSAIVTLLRYMYATKYRDQWIALLPIGGQDGTLKNRFTDVPGAVAIHAKTGSLTHVATLSGYVLPRGGTPYAFSIMVNNFNEPAAEVRAVIDKIVVTLVNGDK